jgi:hypothetical protein
MLCKFRYFIQSPFFAYTSKNNQVICNHFAYFIFLLITLQTDPSGHAVYSVDLRPLASWDCGFESRQGHGCHSLVSVVCCQVEVSATDRSLVQRSPTECGVS